VKPGTLVLADLGYFGFRWFDELTEQGYSWISRVKGNTTVVVLHTYYEAGETFDRLVWLGACDTLGKYAVRQVQFRQGGGRRRVFHQCVRSDGLAFAGNCSALRPKLRYRTGILDTQARTRIASDLE
jgi:hypothetical protein